MKKWLLDKKFSIAVCFFAIWTIVSLFFTMQYYVQDDGIYKTSGFAMLDRIRSTYGVSEVLLFCSVIAAGLLIMLSVLRLFEKRMKLKRFVIIFMVLGIILCVLVVAVFAAYEQNIYVIGGSAGSFKLYYGAGAYLHLIFSLLCSAFCITESVLNLKTASGRK